MTCHGRLCQRRPDLRHPSTADPSINALLAQQLAAPPNANQAAKGSPLQKQFQSSPTPLELAATAIGGLTAISHCSAPWQKLCQCVAPGGGGLEPPGSSSSNACLLLVVACA